MTLFCIKTLCVWLIAGMILVGFPVMGEAVISDSSTEGAVITVGLFAAIVAVLFIVGFKSDMDNVFGQRAGRSHLAQYADEEFSALEYEAPASASGLGLRLTF